MKFEDTEVWGFEHGIRGARNSLNSWEQSDSGICKGGDSGIGCTNCAAKDTCSHQFNYTYQIGKNDLKLLQELILMGTEHRKFMRQIMVSVDITAPLYWFKEFDTYKAGTVEDFSSNRYKIYTKEFTLNDFSHDHLNSTSLELLSRIILELNVNRNGFNNHTSELAEAEEQKIGWRQMVQLLPISYNLKRTILINYEGIRNLYFSGINHKLDEWSNYFTGWVESLPFAAELILYGGRDKA
ncbi:hypothetical protein [Clostridium transplantifaecale]|uniref:hypothetical protein n=1 Tax=Clostridium transplantifaecale TaxID=2479838 RepID=UPI000F63197C|nr:hypothetical protein [Clostridium transplantifaecale]